MYLARSQGLFSKLPGLHVGFSVLLWLPGCPLHARSGARRSPGLHVGSDALGRCCLPPDRGPARARR
eukprot:4364858-Pyramimonas_sp.AAC.1